MPRIAYYWSLPWRVRFNGRSKRIEIGTNSFVIGFFVLYGIGLVMGFISGMFL